MWHKILLGLIGVFGWIGRNQIVKPAIFYTTLSLHSTTEYHIFVNFSFALVTQWKITYTFWSYIRYLHQSHKCDCTSWPLKNNGCDKSTSSHQGEECTRSYIAPLSGDHLLGYPFPFISLLPMVYSPLFSFPMVYFLLFSSPVYHSFYPFPFWATSPSPLLFVLVEP